MKLCISVFFGDSLQDKIAGLSPAAIVFFNFNFNTYGFSRFFIPFLNILFKISTCFEMNFKPPSNL